MTGRSSRSAGRSRAALREPTEDAQTQSTTEESSQSGRQGDRVGVDPDPESTIVIPHNQNVDVRAPMSLAQMRQTIDDEALSTEQLQILGNRIRELTEAPRWDLSQADSQPGRRQRRRCSCHQEEDFRLEVR